MLTVGSMAIFRSAFDRNMAERIVMIVRILGSEYSDEESYRVKDEAGAGFCCFVCELTAL